MLTHLPPKPFSSAEEYTHFVRKFVTLLDQQFQEYEQCVKNPKDSNDLYRLASVMPALICLVNTVGYLRGQDDMFLNIRPHTNNQKEFYNYEDWFEERLNKLIDILMHSKARAYYQARLESYLVKTRTQQKPTIW
jgi:hypothetical protein